MAAIKGHIKEPNGNHASVNGNTTASNGKAAKFNGNAQDANENIGNTAAPIGKRFVSKGTQTVFKRHASNGDEGEFNEHMDASNKMDKSLEGGIGIIDVEDAIEAEQDNATALDYFICGGFGGLLAVLIGHPFDTIKVRLQTDSRYTSTWHCATTTFNRDGVRGFYRGMSAPLFTICPIFAISFMGYKMGKTFVSQMTGTHEKYFETYHHLCAGGLSGTLTTLIMAPGERIKCLLQIAGTSSKSRRAKKMGPLTLIKDLYREDGLRSIYRGSAATLLRDIPSTAAYFGTYEMLKRMSIRHFNMDPCSSTTHLFSIFAGGMAGTAFWLVGMPADVLKSRVQTAPTGMYPNGVRSAALVLLRTEGPLALYTGLLPVMLRAFPANAATFFGFELMHSVIYWAKNITTCD